jgi:anti-sigma-K factor RskA
MGMADDVHELAAPYALDVLDEAERRRFEVHLDTCARCRDDVDGFRAAAAALAVAAPPSSPPEGLRGRILDAARDERQNVVPLRRRRPFQLVAAAAAVAACAAVAVGIWAVTLDRSLSRERAARSAEARAAAILADPAAHRIALAGRPGALYVQRDGKAALVVQALPAAPNDKTYEAWVIRAGTAQRAAIFRGGGRTIVALERRVPRGSIVGVTLERAGGVDAPTSAPFVRARV